MADDLRCVNCSGHYHRFGPMQDCALLDCACAQWVMPGDECGACGGSGFASTLDGRTLGKCSACDGDGSAPVAMGETK